MLKWYPTRKAAKQDKRSVRKAIRRLNPFKTKVEQDEGEEYFHDVMANLESSDTEPPTDGEPVSSDSGADVGVRSLRDRLEEAISQGMRRPRKYQPTDDQEGSEETTPQSQDEPRSSGSTLPDIISWGSQLLKQSKDTGVSLGRSEPSEEGLELSRLIRKEVIAGGVSVSVFFLFFGGWAAFAPLSSAAIAPGFVSPEGSRKTVQHLEGGIIEKILVEDGSVIEIGQPLVLLEDTMARASYQLMRTQYFTLAARQSRLTALQSSAEDVKFPDWLLREARDQETYEILQSQRQLLMTHNRAHADKKAVLNQRIGQLREEIKGLNAQVDGQTRQLELITKEINGVQQLVDKGLERAPRLLGLQRTEAEIGATRGANLAAISRTEQAIGEAELELIAADTVLQNEIAQELSTVQLELTAAGERLAASTDVLDRIQISAPVSGTVVELRFHTPGGIIGAGQPILDIVPMEERLLIEARVSPMDIDVVHVGLVAQVHLSAFAQRNMSRIEGVVRHVSADRLQDQVTGEAYYQAIVEVAPSVLEAMGEDVEFTPGMPAEVVIVTGESTLLNYLIKPATDTIRRSFREG